MYGGPSQKVYVSNGNTQGHEGQQFPVNHTDAVHLYSDDKWSSCGEMYRPTWIFNE